ncbi:hypothetical protein J6590_038341 [Homalodisca vitripennis]|nr:hypothetical protein J6590_038341 [Homalodisca vitripennis]
MQLCLASVCVRGLQATTPEDSTAFLISRYQNKRLCAEMEHSGQAASWRRRKAVRQGEARRDVAARPALHQLQLLHSMSVGSLQRLHSTAATFPASLPGLLYLSNPTICMFVRSCKISNASASERGTAPVIDCVRKVDWWWWRRRGVDSQTADQTFPKTSLRFNNRGNRAEQSESLVPRVTGDLPGPTETRLATSRSRPGVSDPCACAIALALVSNNIYSTYTT